MKKTAVFLLIAAILAFSAIPAYGDGISVSTENKDKISLFDDVSIAGPSKGNVIAVLGNITVEGELDGQVVAVFGNVAVDGTVSGQVVTVFGKTVLAKDSVVKGDVISIGSLNKADGARIYGQEVRILGESMNLDITAIGYLRLVTMILFTAAILVIGLLILLISKKRYAELEANIEKNTGKKLLLGILAFMGASVLMLLLIVTLIAPFLYLILLVISTIPASMYLGKLILRTFSPKNSIYAEFITGLITITLAKLLIIFLVPQQDIPAGFVLAGLLNIFVYSLGFGVYMDERYAKK